MGSTAYFTDMSFPAIQSCPAVLIIAFNRKDTVSRVMTAVRQAKPARLYLACDGPRLDRAGEREAVAAVHEVLQAVDWPCEVKTRFLDENLGCARGVSSAIAWFLEEAGEGIILEDDCLPSPAFFPFAAAMLKRYRHDQRVAQISGSNMVPEVSFSHDHGFSRLATCWGWATWRRAWDGYALLPAMVELTEPWARNIDQRAFRFLAKGFRKILSGNVHTWDYQWVVHLLRRGQLTVVPRKNLVVNIGFDGQGAHYNDSGRRWWVPAHAFDFQGDWAEEVSVVPSGQYDRNYAVASFAAVGQWARAWVKVQRWFAFRRCNRALDRWTPSD